jgi:hypothetical protein
MEPKGDFLASFGQSGGRRRKGKKGVEREEAKESGRVEEEV